MADTTTSDPTAAASGDGKAPAAVTNGATADADAAAVEGGSYDVIRGRLLAQAEQLRLQAEALNQKRIETFGGSQLVLLATERVRTENNCVPRDIRAVQGKLLFAYNVFIGLKGETVVSDVFSVHNFAPKADGSFDLEQQPITEGHYLADREFVREFSDLYRYYRESKILQIRTTDTRLVAVFQVGARPTDQKVFRWGIDKGGGIKFIDTRGDEDNVLPKQHDFEWKSVTREDQRSGDHPHYSIFDEVFVDTIGGDITFKIENNTKDGKGVYREPVDDANQTLDDAEVHYARVGVLILVRIKPYRENAPRFFVYNTRTQQVVRIDAIGASCFSLPEDQGIIFPGGYLLRTGEHKVFESQIEDFRFRRMFKAPNGEDVLYAYDRMADGAYLLLPYNLIRKEIQNPMSCHGYSIFDDGKLVVFKALSDEPTKVHPMQIWQSPFCTQEFAAGAPTDGSYLAKVGNAELVRGISEALTLNRLAENPNPTRQNYEDVVVTANRMVDGFYWLADDDALNLAAIVVELRKTTELIIDEFEKVAAIRRRAEESLREAEAEQGRLLGGALRTEDMRSVEDFMSALASLRKQRGHLITLREMRYMNLGKVDELEKAVVDEFDRVTTGAVDFLVSPTALAPLLSRLEGLVGKIGEAKKAAELKPIGEDVDRVGEGLTVLSDVVGNLKVDDPTQRTKILEGISEAFSQLNRARATLAARRKELAGQEGRSEFAAQFKLFGQSVTSALAICDTPEKCDDQLSKLLLSLEELEGRFSEFDEFLTDLAEKREEVTDAISAKRQQLLDERQKRAQNIVGAADRIVQGINRKARTFKTADDLNTYFASDAMVLKLRDLAKQLFDIGETVKADEVESRLKQSRQDALRALRDKTDLFEDGEDIIKLGKHRFYVHTQPVELALVPKRDEGAGRDVQQVHITGTDFYERIDDPVLEASRDLWDEPLVSESKDLYRGEYLAGSMLVAAEKGEAGLTIEKLTEASTREGGLLELVRAYAQERHDEGYERGVHDTDAVAILSKLVGLRATAGLLRYPADARALACLFFAELPEAERAIVQRRAMSLGRLKERFSSKEAQAALAAQLEPRIRALAERYALTASPVTVRLASAYLVEEAASARFIVSGAAKALLDGLLAELDRAGTRRDLEEDLRVLEGLGPERLDLARSWIKAFLDRAPELARHAHALDEAAVLCVTERAVEREVSNAIVDAQVTGLLGQHPRIHGQTLEVRLDDFLRRFDAFQVERVPRFRTFRKTKQELLEREKKRLRLSEFTPRVLSSFVRNRLIDEVYLPVVGDNLAKQLGAAGAGKRTDLMGLLLLISPPGYGKTTLMEYVASKLGLVFMKVNGPALGHEVTSIDPADAPNATARQEVDKINLALEMGNNVMLYLDDIQHTNPELLQKFISLCDAQRRIEGVWKERTRTYDLRGKKFCVVMAGNPYTESGEKFRIPDMLANRADTYNLGDILQGKDELFALSYIENALTSNRVLAPLSGREPADTHRLIGMAQGKPVPASELAYPYSAAEVSEIVEVLRRLFIAQKILLKVNLEYIASASQDDNFRTEPPFKLQGSYRNMNKIAEKIVAAHTEDEIQRLLDDHYAGESQTLTTGAENNLLKLAELRGRLGGDEAARWEEIKKGFVRVKLMGGKNDDPVARVTGAIAGVGEQLDGIAKTLASGVAEAGAPFEAVAGELQKIERVLAVLKDRELSINVERDPAVVELMSKQLDAVETTLAPVVRSLTEGIFTATAQAGDATRERAAELRKAFAEAAEKAREIAAVQGEAHRAAQHVAAQVGHAAELQAQQVQQARELAQMQASQHALLAQQGQVIQSQAAQSQAIHAQTAQAQQLMQAQQAQAYAAIQAQAHHQAQLQQQQAHQQQALQQIAQQQHAAQQIAQQHAAQQQQQQQQAQRQAAQPAGGRRTRASSLPGAPRPTAPPPGTGLVQRPDATPEENEAIARAQRALVEGGAADDVPHETTTAVFRVEHRLGELTHLVRSLQASLEASAVAQSAHPRYEAILDRQSASNFYRWRAGGDVIREGGLFVALYSRPPDINATVRLGVTLPGGVVFEAVGVVEWTRPEGQKGPPWQQPGFGARFVNLPLHAQKLVLSFVDAREPILFEQR